jgi:hypothetical protein
MKRLGMVLVFILVIMMTSACKKEDNMSLEFYRLSHLTNTNDWVLEDQPLFTGDDILSYDWQSHTITFKDDFLADRNIDEMEDDLLMNGIKCLDLYYPDQLAIYLEDQEVYRTYVEPQGFISFFPPGPMVRGLEDGLMIDCFDPSLDSRNNKDLKAYLEKQGLLK